MEEKKDLCMSLQMVISYILLFMKQGDENGNIYIYLLFFNNPMHIL